MTQYFQLRFDKPITAYELKSLSLLLFSVLEINCWYEYDNCLHLCGSAFGN